ncbi:MAG: hypothetical protein AB1642_07455 [Pseudomonadota bacterium]
MTKDFRNVGRASIPNADKPADSSAESPHSGQRLVLRALLGGGLVFLFGGIWLITGGTGPFPQEQATLIGITFVGAGLADFAVFALLQRVWSHLPKKP